MGRRKGEGARGGAEERGERACPRWTSLAVSQPGPRGNQPGGLTPSSAGKDGLGQNVPCEPWG